MPPPAHRRALQIAVALCLCADPTLTATARAFRGIASFKKLGVRSGALVAPGKGRKSTTVLTIATPPVVVAHWQSKGERTSVRP